MTSPSVDDFMAALDHPRKDEIEHLRQALLGAKPGVTEHIKWNAPSFCFDGDDRITFRLQPGDRVELIFHRGSKVKDTTGFQFDDGGLLDWKTDRASLSFTDLQDVRDKEPALVDVAGRWFSVA